VSKDPSLLEPWLGLWSATRSWLNILFSSNRIFCERKTLWIDISKYIHYVVLVRIKINFRTTIISATAYYYYYYCYYCYTTQIWKNTMTKLNTMGTFNSAYDKEKLVKQKAVGLYWRVRHAPNWGQEIIWVCVGVGRRKNFLFRYLLLNETVWWLDSTGAT
jgi:hypothetical protein